MVLNKNNRSPKAGKKKKKEKAYPPGFENSLIKYHLQISCDSRTCNRATVECRWVFLPRNYQSFANTPDRRRGNLGKTGDTRRPWNQLHKMHFRPEYRTYEQVGGYEDSTGARAELLHHHVSCLLLHVTMLLKNNFTKKTMELIL